MKFYAVIYCYPVICCEAHAVARSVASTVARSVACAVARAAACAVALPLIRSNREVDSDRA